MSIRDPDGLRFAGVLGTVWCVIMCWGAVFIGLAGRVAIPDASALPGGDAEKVFPVLTEMFLHPLLAGAVLAAIFAAIMSTADSQLLVAASAIVRDIYQKLIRKGEDISQRALVLMSRTIVFVIVAIAIYFGMRFAGQLHDLIVLAWSGPGAALGPVMLLAIFWKRTTFAGAIGGILAGVATVLFWANYEIIRDGAAVTLNKAYVGEIVPGFAASLIVCILLSLMTRPPPRSEELLADMRAPRPRPDPERDKIAA
jgi:Na+/proline symporter